MSRRRKRGGAPDSGGDLVPVPAVLAQWLARQVAPALEADKAFLQNPRPQVIVLPRTTQHMSEAERIRRAVMFGRPKPVDSVSYDALRAIARHSIVNSAIHAQRRRAVRKCARKWDGRKGKPGWAIVHKHHFRPDFDATKVAGLDERIRRVEALFLAPHPEFDPTLSQLVVKLVEDHLTVDRMVINTLRSTASNPDTPNAYPTVQLAHVDGATVWPADLYLDRFCQLNGILRGGVPDRDLGLRHLYEHNGIDLRDVHYVQVDPTIGGETPTAFLKAEDLRIIIANPSPDLAHFGFGFGPCESSYTAASLFLHGISYVATFFRDAFSDMVGILAGSTYQDEDAQVIANILRTHHAGVQNMHRTPIIHVDGQPGDLTFQPTRQHSAKEMDVSETLHRAAMSVHAHYGIHPSETFTDPTSPGAGSQLNAPNREAEMEVARDDGLFSILDMLAEDLFTPLVEEWDPELMFVFLGLDEKSEQAEVEMRGKRLEKTLTINEGRKEENLPPLGPWADYPAPQAQAAFQNELQQQMQQHQMELQQQYGQQQGAGGPPGQGDPGAGGGPGGDGEGAQGGPTGFERQENRPAHMQWQTGGEAPGDGDKGAGFIEFVVAPREPQGAGR